MVQDHLQRITERKKGEDAQELLIYSKATADRWANHKRYGVFNCEVMSTQSAESVNAFLSNSNINGKSTVGKMVETLFKFGRSREVNTALQSLKSTKPGRKLSDATQYLFSRVIAHAEDMTNYGKCIRTDEICESRGYHVEEWNNSEDKNIYSATVTLRINGTDKDKTVVTVVDGSRHTCSRCAYTVGHGIADRSINSISHSSLIYPQSAVEGWILQVIK